MMCSALSVDDRRHYTRNCSKIFKSDPNRDRSWLSIDLQGQYDNECEYYDRYMLLGIIMFCLLWRLFTSYSGCHSFSCGLTLDLGKCRGNDLRFTFIGRVGLITALDNADVIPKAWVSFNEGRTSYKFSQEDIKLETTPKSMYGK
jgi:hypothetical protein